MPDFANTNVDRRYDNNIVAVSNQILQGWNTLREIGSGGFGKVYEIEKEGSDGQYCSALKVITIPQNQNEYQTYIDDGLDDESIKTIYKSQVDDIVSEFSFMSQFRGISNIVSYEDHLIREHNDGRGWDVLIRMELLTPLPDYFNTHTMTEKDVADIGISICRALELCGSRNIIHRDIKPQNIFVNDFGEYKLGDFGIARSMDHTTKATKTGTYGYMAPEVYNNEPYGASVDLYSLGLVLYWLLNERRLPFYPLPPTVPTMTVANDAQARRLSGETIPAPANGSRALQEIVLKACSFDKAERYTSPSEMRKALEAIVFDTPKVLNEVKENAKAAEILKKKKERVIIEYSDTDVEPYDSGITVGVFGKKESSVINEETVGVFAASDTPVPKKPGLSKGKKIMAAASAAAVVVVAAAAILLNQQNGALVNPYVPDETVITGEHEQHADSGSVSEDEQIVNSEQEKQPSVQEAQPVKENTATTQKENKKKTAVSVTVSLNLNGGSCEKSELNLTVGKAYDGLPAAAKTGYVFNGWYLNGKKVSASDTVQVASNHTLNAEYSPISYTIRFDGNGATSGSMNDISAQYDNGVGLPACGYSRRGYTFSGWLDEGGTAAYANAESVKNLTSTNGGVVTLRADWSENAISGWVKASQAPSDSDIVDRKYKYTKTSYTESEDGSLSGWNLYNTKTVAGEYGAWSEWSDNEAASSDTREVETQEVIAGYNKKTQYWYDRWRSGWSYKHNCYMTYWKKSADCTTYETTGWMDSPLEFDEYFHGVPCWWTYSGDPYKPCDWWNESTREVDDPNSPIMKTQYRYRDREVNTIYCYKKTESKESSSYPSGNDISDVVEYVRYQSW